MAKLINYSYKFLIISVLVLSTIFTTGMTGKAATTTQYKTTADLNVRTGASTSYKVVFTLKKNTVVTKTGTKGTWFKIKSGSKTGYASSKYLAAVKKPATTTTTASTTVPSKTTYFYVTEPTGLTLRSGAGVTYKSLGLSIPFEAKLKILKEHKNKWIQVKYANKTGWINANSLYGFKSTTSFSTASTVNKSTTYLVLNDNYLNVRKLPNVAAPSIGKAVKGYTAKILRTSKNNWVEVQFSATEKGWISANTTNTTIVNKIDQVGNNTKGTLVGLKFVVDAGHGNSDSGAGGYDLKGNKVYEKTLNLKAAQAIKFAIENLGGTVLMTRNTDTFLTLPQRAAYAKNNGGNAFISVHHNSAGSSAAQGYETYYSDKTNSKEFAESIHNNVIDAIQEEYPEINDRKLKATDFYVIRYNSVFATLLELGFVSNPTELSRLNSTKFRTAVADGVVNGLLEYYGR
ncbi:N-acetylmuramoyl-L-alanine amidase [Kurthia sibirica]|uniref:SH3b domain-containing protein n=1 Tax=Kurthia sibirica TaxID=202750 RepID=A0A2U3AIH2_9BACL|nr:N-acetylmuramoyl-L-alanine amidase [Kurthia sibirica]PWI24349.1 hypothetical protein DEX24_14085 [Kurthia sibirica]GEK33366.1 hypothetical protein KSI01_08990 [Kurthia sibirica]